MIIINNVNLPLDTDFNNLKPIISKRLRTNEIKSVSLYRKSVDARKKNDVKFCCSVLVETPNENAVLKADKNAHPFEEKEYVFKKSTVKAEHRPVVVGFGPAGMFSALALSKAGLNPIVIERGSDVDTRSVDVDTFLKGGKLKTNSNVQFGEGGAGTFSDGKLNTGIKDERCRAVLKEFVKYGANRNILTDAKPHIGTDILKNVVKNLRNDIISLGGEIRFNSRFEDFETENGKLKSVTVNGEKIETDILVLAIGHSARDTYEMLKDKGAEMIRKPFSVGVRIEHLQEDINKALYGEFYNNPTLGAADYKLSCHLENGRGVYSFCMCPGGEVINSSSEENTVTVNGMSYSKRDGENANSAILVGVEPNDIPGDDVLGGCYFQREIEQKAFNASKDKVPITTLGEFLYNKEAKIGRVKPTVKPDFEFCNMNKIFPDFVIDSLKKALPQFGRMIKGFDCEDAIITAPETRSSSPIRILRGENGESLNTKGIYPVGEGAGYAGGIMSAAVDGIKAAEKIILWYEAGNRD